MIEVLGWALCVLLALAMSGLPDFLISRVVGRTEPRPDALVVRMDIEAWDPAEAPPPPTAAEHFREHDPTLRSLGFEHRALLHDPPMGWVSLYFHPLDGDRAVLVSIQPETSYLEFSTEHEDEVVVDTNDATELGVLARPESHHVFQFPEVEDVAELHRRHRALVSVFGSSAPKVAHPPGCEVEEAREARKRVLDRQVSAGLMRTAPDGSWRVTVWGFCLMAGSLLPPFSTIRRIRNRRAATRALASTGYRPGVREPRASTTDR
ncbi:MAG: hypothetical protein AAF533_07015 [Acidobacteriota bacterium]